MHQLIYICVCVCVCVRARARAHARFFLTKFSRFLWSDAGMWKDSTTYDLGQYSRGRDPKMCNFVKPIFIMFKILKNKNLSVSLLNFTKILLIVFYSRLNRILNFFVFVPLMEGCLCVCLSTCVSLKLNLI
jgi:hypothetical protein